MVISSSVFSSLTLKQINCFSDFNSASYSPLKFLSPKISKALEGILSPSADLFFVMLTVSLSMSALQSTQKNIVIGLLLLGCLSVL